MSEFDEIRPYNDSEVVPTLQRLLEDKEFLDTVAKLGLPRAGKYIAPLVRGLIRGRLQKETASIQTVADLQAKIEFYLGREINRTITHLSISGLDNFDRAKASLFVSNHRDIVMDPALVNWSLYKNGFTTLRIAIGDNLLTKPFASDLMRLNKSFIVNRSATAPREKLKAAKLLSKYIHHSVLTDNENVWIAQREGRAKDGIDVSNQAIISMFALSKPKTQPFEEFIREARIVPVTLSYEYDPCDTAKAKEIYQKETEGTYKKGEHEDVKSIATGITGFKGCVHVHFGEPLTQNFENAEQVKLHLDKEIISNYVLHPSNCIAYEMLEKRSPKVLVGEKQIAFDTADWQAERKIFADRIATCDPQYLNTLLKGYANPVYRKLSLTANAE
ncbi:1-acyl-sn-glycerol-3-phosphate acyltransferase [Saccharophagus degradans]|uniref:Phospholipid/glycerol acyltransferase n=1 Tax=Saccharophagus degradans (strain 2-40 / ATCC 43961 / DSM 17024) TaxID=203122 RepID=Q21I37_SACD2|nr:1-acyl-sn-glycerol-3-phosphate acyltransferase [Saccharophagus degradans]ABD81642.1 Phospholipid/glycerol acyltransferase [Saccharophagus degradans 2-40]WGP00144.1 1-acyl-sn-glycerol-3-phosphate acyltransferase [Saccharophagus degradans]